jgi:hypothetical protein
MLVIQLLQILFASGTTYLLYRLVLRVFADHPATPSVALLAAAAWYASPVVLPHTMNCLETGLYGLTVVATAWWFSEERAEWSWSRFVAFGAALGIVFLARNDAVFWIAAMCGVHVIHRSARERTVKRRLLESLLMGATSVIVASPWLIYNAAGFGHIVPVSGQSEAMGAQFGGNAALAVTVLVEYVLLLVPIPVQFQETTPVVVASLLLLLLVVVPLAVAMRRASSGRAAHLFDLVAVYAALLFIYYGLVFGAPWFVSRYFFPLSPFVAILSVWALTRLLVPRAAARSIRQLDSLRPLLYGLALIAVSAAAFANARLYWKGSRHQHFQVVEWVRRNVPEDAWVAAPQSGTLGFFHDRTLNLDGKVSPEALSARRNGRIPEYALAKGVRYFVDWYGLQKWAMLPALRGRVEVLVADSLENLAVLRVLGAARAQENVENE